MMDDYFVCGNISSNIVPNIGEVVARLSVDKDFSLDSIKKCRDELVKSLDIKYVGVKVDVSYPDENVSDIGFGPVKSSLMYNKLKGCNKAFVFAVTLGHDVDRLLKRLSVTSVYEHYVVDALASSYAERACDVAQNIIKGDIACYIRFSPGYGDISLEIQPRVLELLCAGKYINIAIGKNFLMSPTKSITAIMGIKK
ncbi:MAG: hypothetical protein UH081_05745 [Clostridia bacterium]|nr:hypothetical protein [Clostridia bacterium]